MIPWPKELNRREQTDCSENWSSLGGGREGERERRREREREIAFETLCLSHRSSDDNYLPCAAEIGNKPLCLSHRSSLTRPGLRRRSKGCLDQHREYKGTTAWRRGAHEFATPSGGRAGQHTNN